MRLIFATALVSAVFAASCVGNIGDGVEGGGSAPEVVDPALVPTGGLRRLTAAEYFNTVNDLLGNDTLPVTELLPSDPRTPFDNDYMEQIASQGLIDSADFLAERAADDLIADSARRDAVVGCTPTGPDDEVCLRSFVESFGRRALRRPLSDAEVDEYVLGINGDGALPYAIEDDDFYTGVHQVVWSMLQDVEFLYRVEIGTEVEGQPGVHRLTDFEIASRLSYFIWGTMPDEQLLSRAEAGNLSTPAQRREAASRLLADERALARITRFHAMWLGYELMPTGGELGAAMKEETSQLMKRVIFDEKRPWQDLFRIRETFANDVLAEHYGLELPGSTTGAWVSYEGTARAGLLSHGSFLSIGAKFSDTSIVQRGLVIRERLFCQDIGDPPPGVDVDQPVVVENAICKPERFAAHSTGGCASCHQLIDPLGMGLENYDQFGAWRTHEPDNPDTPEDETQCEINAQGEFEYGTFSGPGELGRLALESGVLNDCLSEQLYRFVTGRSELDSVDRRVILAVQDNIGSEEFAFGDLVLEVVGHDSFAFRSQE